MTRSNQPCKDQAGGTARAKALRLDQAWNRVAGAGDAAEAAILQESGLTLRSLELLPSQVGNCCKI